MRLVVIGTDLPGATFCDAGGVTITNVHVGVQVRKDPTGLVRGDAAGARWEVEVTTAVDDEGRLDVRGPAVQGRKGERFVYLTWGHVDPSGGFRMFRRAKLMLDRIDPALLRTAAERGGLVAHVRLTDDRGGPRCARVDPPAVAWSVGEA